MATEEQKRIADRMRLLMRTRPGKEIRHMTDEELNRQRFVAMGEDREQEIMAEILKRKKSR